MTEPRTLPTRVLLLGGTTEASALAARLSTDQRYAGVLSLAGRTTAPAQSAIATRVGGFGGVDGLANFIIDHRIDVLIDATHPFAAQISANAIAASARTGRPLIALERPAWQKQAGDQWQHFLSVADAIDALPKEKATVFSGLGRLSLDELRRAPQHHYVIRVIDPPREPLMLPHATTITARGPFITADDIALFRKYQISIVVAKNAGGSAAMSKIEAARHLHLPVMMIARPEIPPRPTFQTVDEVWQALQRHDATLAKRGV